MLELRNIWFFFVSINVFQWLLTQFWIDFENGSTVHLWGPLKFPHLSRKKNIGSPMVLASLRLTFPLSSFGIWYWPINLAGCLERGKWKEVFVSVKKMAWIFYLCMCQLSLMVSFLHCVNSILHRYLVFTYCSKIWNCQQISMIINIWWFQYCRICFNLAFWTPKMLYVWPSGTLSWIDGVNTFKKTLDISKEP